MGIHNIIHVHGTHLVDSDTADRRGGAKKAPTAAMGVMAVHALVGLMCIVGVADATMMVYASPKPFILMRTP